MEYTTVTNLKYADGTGNVIDCVVDFVGLGQVPFTANSADVEPHGIDIYQRAVAGDFGSIDAFVPYVPTDAELKKASMYKSRKALFRTDIAATLDGRNRMGIAERGAMDSFRTAHFDNIAAGGTTDPHWAPPVTVDLQTAFDKFKI
jgi:hypothetical protein